MIAYFTPKSKPNIFNMKTNDKGLNLIKNFEGCKLKSYLDTGGILTVGYGHTGPDVTSGQIITQAIADALLARDLAKFETGVSNLVTSTINENQFAAMVVFSYNVGLGNLKSSTLLKKVNASDFAGAAAEFLRWNKDNGTVLAGLTRRREAEKSLFEEQLCTTTTTICGDSPKPAENPAPVAKASGTIFSSILSALGNCLKRG